MTIEIDGVVETLVPGRDRLSIDHDFVARDPLSSSRRVGSAT